MSGNPEGAGKKIGVYVCYCGGNISEVVDIKEVVSSAAKQADVAVVRENNHMCSVAGQKLIRDDIVELGLDRVVVAACSPHIHEATFRRTIEKEGLSPYVLEMVNLREQCAWVHFDNPDAATEKAKDLANVAIARARWDEPLQRKTLPVGKSVLVIGAGVAGIQASLDLGDAGFTVYLVEKEPSIGGKMVKLSRTFPTEDCAACILSPKMADVPANPNIKLYAYSEIEDISGYVGNFEVTVLKKPRYVDVDKCSVCGLCTEKCPVKISSKFNEGLTEQKAIYVPFSFAVPFKYLIDE
jgi:heterodisulfide reductase subunit A